MPVNNVSKIKKESETAEAPTGRPVDKRVESCSKLKRNKQKNKVSLVLNQRYELLLKTFFTI